MVAAPSGQVWWCFSGHLGRLMGAGPFASDPSWVGAGAPPFCSPGCWPSVPGGPSCLWFFQLQQQGCQRRQLGSPPALEPCLTQAPRTAAPLLCTGGGARWLLEEPSRVRVKPIGSDHCLGSVTHPAIC